MHSRPLRSAFFAYRDAPERRSALSAPAGALDRYRLFGLDEVASRGVSVRHNLERPSPPVWARAAGRGANRLVYGLGGYGGDFATLVPSLREINRSDIVFSTVDTVGLPLVLMQRLRLVRSPIVYTAIGLPERLEQLRGRRAPRIYREALRATHAIVSYAESEAAWLRDWLGRGARVEFVPFGVDPTAFAPADAEQSFDVVSVGADPRRDFALLLTVAERHPELTFRLVASAEHARALVRVPPNVVVERDIPLARVRERLAAARVVALPVRENSYSGATTTLLQALSMAKPVVVTETTAIATGYGLEDGINCRLVPPGDGAALEQAMLEMLAGAAAESELGNRARETVQRTLSWERYTRALWDILGS